MKNSIEKMACEVAKVRETGLANMYDTFRVVEILYAMGYNETAEYIASNSAKYAEIFVLSKNY